MTTQDEKLKKLEKKRMKVNAEINRIKNAKAKAKRQADTRRKILIGSAILDQVKSGKWTESKMLSMMDNYLTKERDRALFFKQQEESK